MATQFCAKICILCWNTFDSTQLSKRSRGSLDNKKDLIDKFCNNVLCDSEKEQNVASTLNLEAVILCGKCSPVMEAAMDAATIVERLEKKVGGLQLQLLKELKILQSQLSLLYEKVTRIQFLIEASKVASASALPASNAHDGLHVFENRIRQVAKNLSLCNAKIQVKAGSTTPTNAPQPSTNDHKIGMVAVTTPIKSEVNSEDDMDLIEMQRNENLEPQTENEDGNSSFGEEQVGNCNESGCVNDDNNESDEDDNAYKMDEQSKDKKLGPPLRRKITKKIISSVDFTGMSQFKKQTVICILRRKELVLQKSLLMEPRGESQIEDPRTKYFIDFNPETDSFSLDDVTITLIDGKDGNFLECSKCLFRAEKEKHYHRKNVSPHARMLDHILGKHLNAFQCLSCENTASSYGGYLKHRRWHSSGMAICDICGKPLRSKGDLPRHKWLHMNEEEQRQALASGKKAPTKNFKTQHEETPKPKPFQCSVCGRSFTLKGNLQLHEKCHQSREERVTVCPVCGKSMMPRTLYSHQKICQLLAKESLLPVKCIYGECERKFNTIRLMKAHFKRVHSKEGQQRNQHKCPTCDKGFMTNSEMTKHIRSHSSERPYTCSKGCQAKFKTKKVRTNHEKVCMGFGTRPGPKTGKRKPKLTFT